MSELNQNQIINDLQNQYIAISPTEEDEDYSQSSGGYKTKPHKFFINDDFSSDNVSNSKSSKKYNPNLIYSKESGKVQKLKGKNISNNNVSSNNVLSYKNLLKKFEIQVQRLNTELTETKNENYQIKQDILNLQNENGFVKLEKEKMMNIKDNEINLLNEKLINLENNNNLLNKKYEETNKKFEEIQPKIWKFDELNEKYNKLSEEKEKLTENNTNLSNLLAEIKKENNDLNSKLNLLSIENENLKQDKIYLNKNLMFSDEKVKNLTSKINTLEEDLRETRKLNQNYIDKLTEKNLNMDNNYKDKINEELSLLKSKYETKI